MDRSEVVKLIHQTYTENEIGEQIAYETERLVFCNVKSCNQNEFFKAGEIGLKPTYTITMFRYDYEDEKICEYNGVRYNVYRSFVKDNEELELYLNQVKGV